MRASFTDRINLLREFLTLGLLGTIATVVGIGSGLNSIFGGGSSQPSAPTSGAAPSYYQPTGQPQADQSWLNAMNQINSGVNAQSGMVQPQLNNAYQNMTNVNPSGYVNAGNQAGSQYAQQAQLAAKYQQMMQGQGGLSAGAQQNLMGAGNQMFAAGQDPQGALYQKMLQQTQDQSRAATSMRGIGMSPESAGIENQAVGNFNIDWQNQQLARMLSGGQGMTQAYNAAGQQGQLTGANLQSASNYGGQIPTNTLQSGAVPFNTAQTAYGAPITATNAYTGAMNQGVYQPYGAIQTNAMPYMNYGMNSANNAFGTGAAQQTFNANQQAAGMNGLTQGLNQLSNNQPSWMSGMFGGGSSYVDPNSSAGYMGSSSGNNNYGYSLPS